MTLGTPTGGSQTSQDASPGMHLVNGEDATYFNMGFHRLQQQLEDLDKKRRQATPETASCEPEATPMPARQKCAGLWASLPNEEMLDLVRENIPCAWYQLYTASTLLQLLVLRSEKDGLWSGGSSLLGDETSSDDESSHEYWRNLADRLCHLLDKVGATKGERRAHLQEIQLNDFWEVELNRLEPIVATEEQYYHDSMAKKAQQAESEKASAPHPTAPQLLQSRQRRKAGKFARSNKSWLEAQKGRVRQEPTPLEVATPNAARDIPENISTSCLALGIDSASTKITRKPSKLACGLNTENIIDHEKRSLRRPNLAPQVISRVLDGRIGRRKLRGQV